MVSHAPAPAPAPAQSRPATRLELLPGRVLRTALRLAVAAVLYLVYAHARNRNGLASADAGRLARRHAEQLVTLERALHLPSEHAVQAVALHATLFVRACGAFYGTAHFAVTVGLLVLVAVRRPAVFDRWAGTLAISTFLAVGAFALHPTAPPRLLPPPEGTVDTLATVGGVWSYDHGVLEHISDPYAALPSLHLAWATWCALVVWDWASGSPRRALWRCVAVAYPLVTLVVVVVTGNHWWLDAVAGTALVLAVRAALQAFARRVRPELVRV